MEVKAWYLSKTLWTNFIGLVLVVAVPSIQQYVSGDRLAEIFMVLNLGLRLVTKGKIEIS